MTLTTASPRQHLDRLYALLILPREIHAAEHHRAGHQREERADENAALSLALAHDLGVALVAEADAGVLGLPA